MAFLLLLHEKMRLKRQVNKLTLKQTQYGSRLDRMTKNIARVQKMYSSKMTQIEKQAQMMQSAFTTQLQNAWGLGAQNQMFNPMYGGVTSFVANQIGSLLSGGVPVGDKGSDGKPTSVTFTQDQYQKLMNEYMSGTLRQYTDKDGNVQKGQYGADGSVTEQEYKAFMMALNQAQSNQSKAQMMCQQMTSTYQQNISVWVDAQKAQLNAEQDAALAPLEAEQTDMELEKESIETQLAYAKERLQTIEQACSEGIKDSAPKFGLG